MSASRDHVLLRLLDDLRLLHASTRQADALLRVYLRRTRAALGADAICLATATPDGGRARIRHAQPGDRVWDAAQLGGLLRDESKELPSDLVIAPLRRRDRAWGVLAMARDSRPFERGDGRALARVARQLGERLAELDDAKARRVQERIARQVLERRRPKDVVYHILHGLKSLTRYDHSSALLGLLPGGDELELVAEQAAWTKTKSRAIGRRLELGSSDLQDLERGVLFGGWRNEAGWHAFDGTPWSDLVPVLAFHDRDADAPTERALLCAPLLVRGELLGVLKVSSKYADRLGKHEAELLRRFQLLAAAAFANSQLHESLRQDVLRAERKHAMANLARGISHDVNNALGAMLPTVQQLRAELGEDDVDMDAADRDLLHLERAVQTCRRVFRGLLEFSRNHVRQVTNSDPQLALDNALAILQSTMERNGIELCTEWPSENLPRTRGAQHEVEQLALNLLSNACDAMTDGGQLQVQLRPGDQHCELVIKDDGVGMDDKTLNAAAEAFYTTKPHGTGLGLSICHGIVQDLRGRLILQSEPGQGTTATVVLPLAPAQPLSQAGDPTSPSDTAPASEPPPANPTEA